MSYNPRRSLDTVLSGLAKFIDQFKNKKNLTAELTSFLNRLQEAENTLWDIILGRSLAPIVSPQGVTLSVAQGVQLDIIGKIVGAPRAGLSDSDYLVALNAAIFVNRSSGIPEDFLHLLKISSPPSVFDSGVTPWSVTDLYPATVLVQILIAVTWNPLVTWNYLKLVKGAGIRLLMVYSTATPNNTFTPYDANVSAPTTDTAWDTSGGGDPHAGVFATVLGA